MTLPTSGTAGSADRRPMDAFTTGTGTYTHQDLSYVRRKRRGKHHHGDPAEEQGELNIVPYLDIITNLIIFLLVMQSVLVSVGMIDVTAPSYTTAAPTDAKPDEDKPDLRLTLGVARDGFYIAASGGVLPGEASDAPTELTADNVTKRAPTVPKLANGAYDFATLGKKLRTIKAAFPETRAVYIAADETVPYEIIVKTLDASREDAKGELFPGVAFTQID
ncbi:MAG: hypothetical protein HC923_06660 [Myxococcales bacterium]|nr:hypothetical protein [Myxococcales bacterium]